MERSTRFSLSLSRLLLYLLALTCERSVPVSFALAGKAASAQVCSERRSLAWGPAARLEKFFCPPMRVSRGCGDDDGGKDHFWFPSMRRMIVLFCDLDLCVCVVGSGGTGATAGGRRGGRTPRVPIIGSSIVSRRHGADINMIFMYARDTVRRMI